VAEAHDPPLTMMIPILALMVLSLISTVFALPIIGRLLGV
jgi:hypothetical protein